MAKNLIQVAGQEVSQTNPLPVAQISNAGSTSGGSSIYSNAFGDFTATANSGAKTITLSAYASTILSSVISTTNFLNAVIKRKSSAGVVDTLPISNVAFAANVITLSDMAANFASGDTVAVFIQGPDKGFDEANDLQKVTMGSGIAATTDSIAAKLSTDAIMIGNTELTPKRICISVASSGNNTVLAAVTGKSIRILSGHLSFSGTCNLKFQSGAGGTDISKLYYGVAGTNVPINFSPLGHYETAASALLNAALSASVAVDINLTYVEV